MNAKDIAAKLENETRAQRALEVQSAVSLAAVTVAKGDYAALCSGMLSALVMTVAVVTVMTPEEFGNHCAARLAEVQRILAPFLPPKP